MQIINIRYNKLDFFKQNIEVCLTIHKSTGLNTVLARFSGEFVPKYQSLIGLRVFHNNNNC